MSKIYGIFTKFPKIMRILLKQLNSLKYFNYNYIKILKFEMFIYNFAEI